MYWIDYQRLLIQHCRCFISIYMQNSYNLLRNCVPDLILLNCRVSTIHNLGSSGPVKLFEEFRVERMGNEVTIAFAEVRSKPDFIIIRYFQLST